MPQVNFSMKFKSGNAAFGGEGYSSADEEAASVDTAERAELSRLSEKYG